MECAFEARMPPKLLSVWLVMGFAIIGTLKGLKPSARNFRRYRFRMATVVSNWIS